MQTAVTHPSTLPQIAGWTRSIPGRIVLVFAATLVVAAAAHASIPLWFTPVPLTLQPLAVLLVGLVLGPLDGALAMFAYLAEGAAGMPVFSPVGPGGVLQLFGPTGGFLMAYPAVAAITGSARTLSARMPALTASRGVRFLAGLIVATVASLVLFTSGASWFAHLTHLSAQLTWAKTVAPFLLGAAVNITVAAGTFATTRSIRRT